MKRNYKLWDMTVQTYEVSSKDDDAYRYVEIEFSGGSTKLYKIWESMYDIAKHEFYHGDGLRFIVGYELSLDTIAGGYAQHEHKTHINLSNVCRLKVIEKFDGQFGQ
jgi:hypothetical protein